jgi:hypothetical protein
MEKGWHGVEIQFAGFINIIVHRNSGFIRQYTVLG